MRAIRDLVDQALKRLDSLFREIYRVEMRYEDENIFLTQKMDAFRHLAIR